MERYRIDKDVGLYYLTFSVVEWLPVFIDQASCRILVDSFKFCIQNKWLGINAYVFLPTHIHAILFDRQFDQERLKRTLDDFRKLTGRKLLEHAAAQLPSCSLGHGLRVAPPQRSEGGLTGPSLRPPGLPLPYLSDL